MEPARPIARVQNIVVNALLESFYDILDRDGKNSILKAAGRADLIDAHLNPQDFIDYQAFLQIIDAMNDLLQFSEFVAYEIGRKFAIYSDPSGTGIDLLVKHLKQWIQADWDIELVSSHPKSPILVLKVTNCPFCGSRLCNTSRAKVPCNFLRGVFSMACEKTSRQCFTCAETNHVFTLTNLQNGGR